MPVALRPGQYRPLSEYGVVRPEVYDPILLDYVVMQQPLIETDLVEVSIAGPLAVTGTFWQTTQPISAASLPLPAGAASQTTLAALLTELEAKANLGETQPVSLATAPTTPVTGTFFQATQPVSIAAAITANPATAFGKTLTYVAINQIAAGTTVLAAAQGSNKHKLIGLMLTLSVVGTAKLTDGVGDLIGATDLAATGGFVLPPSMIPWTETGAINRALNLVTTLGAARGVAIILSEP